MDTVSATEAGLGIKPWEHSSRFIQLFQTSDQKATESFMSQFAKPYASSLQMNFGANLNLDFRAFEFAEMQVSAIRYSTEVSTRFKIQNDDRHQPWRFIYNLGGHSIGNRLNIQTHPGDAVLVQLDGSADYQLSSEYEALMLEVSDKDMKQAYQTIYGAFEGMNLNLAISCPAGSAAALTLLRTISRISQTPKYTHSAAPQLERGIKETALLEILMNWPVGTVPIIQEAVLPASTKLARDFIHAYIQDLPTVSDVAASCGIGVRALDRGFKKHLGVSPLQYMLELRLQAVHDDLIANRNGNTVTDVAIHWGFLNLGIFAARYREKFGELPSKTLMHSRQLRQRLN